MPAQEPVLHLVCGKIAAGKSTLTAGLGAHPGTIVVAEDRWLARLYPDAQTGLADYVRHSARLRSVMGPHVVDLLRAGLSVVLDFPANTLASRAWMRTLFEEAGVAHRLHSLDVSDDVCKARLRARNASGTHDFTVTDAEFELFTQYFVAPTPEEGFNVILHRP
ncbi:MULTISPECIES: AAA family ATPase [unclassified Methylobacterium]|uniref:AAA family ATPase n=1 Tax=unclassified Methylobacterium TaxID=2615210 RepID=UPI001FBA145E|nr:MULTISPECIES: ATP-binding protein [unclassified Methylobacterium]MCJ2092840.1 ATP-binding protein [Methylobacterium sp. J-072]MCJ2141850.1 ATP-binding protein [Methylobacterium sp. E-066]